MNLQFIELVLERENLDWKTIADKVNLEEKELKRQIDFQTIRAKDLFVISQLLGYPIGDFFHNDEFTSKINN